MDRMMEAGAYGVGMSSFGPTIYSVFENGYDILRPIAESHISIHCYNDCIIDVFSCNNFDEKKIIEILNEIYSIRSIERGIFLTKS